MGRMSGWLVELITLPPWHHLSFPIPAGALPDISENADYSKKRPRLGLMIAVT